MLMSVCLMAQERIAFGGGGYVANKAAAFVGMALPLGSDGKTFSYTDMDFSIGQTLTLASLGNIQTLGAPGRAPIAGPVTIAGHVLQYAVRTGLAYKILTIKNFDLLALGAPGIITNGSDTVSSFEYGGILHYKISPVLGIMAALSGETNGGVTDFAPRLGFTLKF